MWCTSPERFTVLRILLVDQAGVEPASRTLFSLLRTAIPLRYTLPLNLASRWMAFRILFVVLVGKMIYVIYFAPT